jgi:hypothetical protein
MKTFRVSAALAFGAVLLLNTACPGKVTQGTGQTDPSESSAGAAGTHNDGAGGADADQLCKKQEDFSRMIGFVASYMQPVLDRGSSPKDYSDVNRYVGSSCVGIYGTLQAIYTGTTVPPDQHGEQSRYHPSEWIFSIKADIDTLAKADLQGPENAESYKKAQQVSRQLQSLGDLLEGFCEDRSATSPSGFDAYWSAVAVADAAKAILTDGPAVYAKLTCTMHAALKKVQQFSWRRAATARMDKPTERAPQASRIKVELNANGERAL